MDDALQYDDDALMKYLDGEMEQDEKTVIERQVQQDAELRERLRNLQLAIAAVKQFGTTQKVAAIHKEMMVELSPAQKDKGLISLKSVLRYGMAVAASLIVVVVGFNLYKASQINAEKLYNEAFVDYDASVVRGQQTASALQESYQDHNYQGVTKQAVANNLSQQDSLLVGISYLKLDQPKPAMNWLRPLSRNGALSNDAEFYLSLAYLKNKNFGEAANLMEDIETNPKHVYHDQFSSDYVAKVKKLASK